MMKYPKFFLMLLCLTLLCGVKKSLGISSKLCGLLRNSESEYMNFTMHHQFYYFIGLGVHCTLPLWSFLGLFIGLLEVTSDLSFHKSKTNLNQSKMTLKLKFIFSKKATKIDEIFTVDLTLCSKRQIDGEDFVNFRGLFIKYEL